ncbi:MAG: ABC transporter permease [Acidobacteria bacterium]|nr:ABC transporter permease [Acidobacteriota bacterium]
MATLREWIRRLWGTLRRNPLDREMEEELRSHLDLAAEDILRRGGSTEDALRAARLQAGGVAQAMESQRDQRGFPWLDDLSRDLSHGLRTLRRTPMFTAVALLTLALGIGANTAIFSIVNGVILRPLEYPKPEQLMYLTAEFPVRGLTSNPVSAPEYLEFRRINQSFASVGAYDARAAAGVYTTGEVNLTAGDRPLRVRSMAVDAYLFGTLGIQPAQGRFFTEQETARGTGLNEPVAILSHELWQTQLGGEPLIGKTVSVDGRPHEILGIMPPGIDLMDNRTEIWLPLGLPSGIRQSRTFHILHVIGRLKEGVTAEAARAELNALLENWGERTGASGHVPTNRPTLEVQHTLQMQPLQDAIVGDARRSIWILQVAVGFVLLIACANLANLLLARAETRRREFALRAALGASRSRLVRQTITEGILLSVAGGALGLVLAAVGVQALIRAYVTSVPRLSEVTIDVSVLLFTLGISVATGILFGLAPAVQRFARDLATALKEAGDRSASGTGRHHIRRLLVAAEIALAVMLVIGAGLLIRTVYNLTSVDAGFDRSRLATFATTLAEPYDPDTRALAYQRLLDKLRAVPGVEEAAIMSGLPPRRPPQAIGTVIENHIASDGRPVEIIDYYQGVMGDYFGTMGISIVAGRGFESVSATSSNKVVVVNETLAKKIWSDRDPIGRRVRVNLGAFGFADNPWHTVIGVARDVKQGGVEKQAGTELYVSLDQVGLAPPTMNVVLRTALPPAALARTLDRLVQEVDPAVPIVRLRDMDVVFAESIRRPRLLAVLLGAFAGLALLLAAVGTYGVLAYMVAERRREIGIRMALGADRSSVFALVMKQGLQITIIGVVIGVAVALGLNRLIASLLFGVQPTDAATLVAVVATITLVAAIACWLPAWRASRVDPTVMLRHE